tara:strand:- start:2845 stop:4692 length:1848 start_codon:yes stop_codon:yes gene_type:complete
MPKNIKKEVKLATDVSYLNKDFDSFRSQLVSYAAANYSEQINDFTQAGLGGLFVDMAAYVGDSLSFYLDHQFNELNLETAIEEKNIERLVRLAGVKATPKSPATAYVNVSIVVPAKFDNNEYKPDPDLLPVIKSETTFTSTNGVNFYLYDDIDFSIKTDDNFLDANVTINGTDSVGNPASFIITKEGVCTSGKLINETHVIGDGFVPFRTISLRKGDVSEIIFVKDSDNNEYFEVDNLTQDLVYKRVLNNFDDKNLVRERIEMTPASRRFVKEFDRQTGKTGIRFGGGREDVFDDDVIPDPSEFALPLFGDRKTFNSVTIDPNSFLETQTLGIAPKNTIITVAYRSGGGVLHNVPASSIATVTSLIMNFKTTPTPENIVKIRASTSVSNEIPAGGGEEEPTIEELRQIAINNQNSQNRIVTRQDLLSRIYTLPNNFGRVFRAAVVDNPNNPLGARLFIISRNSQKQLIISPDTLKDNLSLYLNQFRLISESIDILDTPIVNIAIKYSISVEKGYNFQSVINEVNASLKDYFKIENFQINQPILISDISNLILNTPGTLSLIELKFVGMSGVIDQTPYSNFTYVPSENLSRGMYYPPPGGIFEVKYPDSDIIGRAI